MITLTATLNLSDLNSLAAFAEYEDASDALDRWNALRAELGLR